jgi:hypothetical protein
LTSGMSSIWVGLPAEDRLDVDMNTSMFLGGRDWLPSRVEGAIIGCLVFFAVALRLRQYLFNRSLWLDEAALAVSVVERSLTSLLSMPLTFNQSAPPGFLLASRSLVSLFGRDEWALRLAPLIAGLLVVVVAVILAQRELKSTAGRVTFVGLVALSPVLIYYSSEFKPYSSDALVASCILLAVSYRHSKYGTWLLAVTGFVGILCSLPAVFVAASAGALLVHEAVRSRQWRQAISVGLAWSAAAAVHFGYFLWAGPNRDYFVQWWGKRGTFAPFPPSSVAELLWYPQSLSNLTYVAFRNGGFVGSRINPLSYDALGWSLTLALVAAVVLVIVTGRRTALVAVGAILATYLAAVLQIYPFSSRLIIFCVPLTFFIIANGIDELRRITGHFAAAVVAGLLLSIMVPRVVEIAKQPQFSSDMRGALVTVSRKFENGDAIALWKSGRLFRYYGAALKKRKVPVVNLDRDELGRSLIEIAERKGYRRIWVVTAHRSNEVKPLIDQAAQTVPIAYEWTAPGTHVVLFDFRRRM